MASLLLRRARGYARDAGSAVERAPVEVVAAVFAAATLSWALEVTGFDFIAWVEVAIVCLLVAGSAWLATLLHRAGAVTPTVRWIGTLAAAVTFGGYGSVVLDLSREAEAWRAATLVAAGACALLAAPAFARGDGSRTDRLRRVNGRIVLRTAGVLIYAAALFAGLALALASIDTLFELDLRGTIYGHVFGWIFLVLVPWIIVGGVPDYVAPSHGDEVGAAIRRMSAFLVPPLLAIYLAIIIAYVLRIALTGEVPKNLVSPLVIAAGMLGLLALLLFDPRPGGRAAFGWLRGVPLIFAPLAVLGIWAIMLRLGDYGITEFRALRIVLLLVLLLLAAGASWQLLRRRAFALHLAPAALAGAFLIAAIGPWSVTALSERSQQRRLAALLAEAGLTDALPAATGGVTRLEPELYENLRSTAHYLAAHFGPGALPAPLARYASTGTGYYDLLERAGVRAAGSPMRPGAAAGARLAGGVAVPAANGVVYYRVQFARDPTPRGGEGRSRDVHAVQEGMRLNLRVQATHFVADLAVLDDALRSATDARLVELGAGARLDVTGATGDGAGHLLILDAHADWTGGEFRLQHLDALLVLEPRDSAYTR